MSLVRVMKAPLLFIWSLWRGGGQWEGEGVREGGERSGGWGVRGGGGREKRGGGGGGWNDNNMEEERTES